jgi:poly(hydroxyalkanoate) depolymerase family esterase
MPAWRLVLLLAVVGVAPGEVAAAGPRDITRWSHSFYYPASAVAEDVAEEDRRVPLVVYLHGCQQPAWHAALTTRLKEWAEYARFAVLMPEQSHLRNGWKCWNWFLGDNTSEMDMVVRLVEAYQEQFGLLRTRTYVMGLSAGGVMSAHLLACRSDVFSAGAVFSGAAYRALGVPAWRGWEGLGASPRSPEELAASAARCMARRESPRPVPVLVFHGATDVVAWPANAPQVAHQFSGANHIITRGPGGLAGAFRPVQHRVVRAAPANHDYAVTLYPEVGGARVVLVRVTGLGHAWSGGPGWVPFSDPAGPDATAMALEFLGLLPPRLLRADETTPWTGLP